ncbi:GNAT family N-acetyltransferase [Thermohalobacter berrensis]|uniref:GNAT family N-acetyltransferase n=1 Tax=Thermohalobacter berrensis TaxID=99594 RepID=A0A419T2B8_9FIRM|nr:GNAT family N-acetyltransferase [Thermohalobacter berrensis]
MKQPEIICINKKLRLRRTKEEDWKKALNWYQNPKVLYYSEGVTTKVYSMEVIKRMYKHLSNIGELYFIEVFENEDWKAIGDVTLSEKNMPIVIGEERYWGKGIGKKVISKLINRAKDIKLKKIYIPSIYKYNERSRNLFESLGFVKVAGNEKEDSYELRL